MTDDLVKRLQDADICAAPYPDEVTALLNLTQEAANVLEAMLKEIERDGRIIRNQKAEIERLRKDKELLGDSVHYAHAHGFEWPVDPWTGVSDD